MPLPVIALLGAAASGAAVREAYVRYARWAYGEAPGSNLEETQVEFAVIQANVVTAVSADHVRQFLEGLCVGFSMSELPDLQGTLVAAQEVYAELTLAVGCFRKGGEQGLIAGLEHLSQALRALAEALKEAGNLAPELQRVISIFRGTPHLITGTADAVFMNGKEIYGELRAATVAWHDGKFRTSGEHVGKALATLAD
eukprot:tig00000553_g2100.t1